MRIPEISQLANKIQSLNIDNKIKDNLLDDLLIIANTIDQEFARNNNMIKSLERDKDYYVSLSEI